MLWCKGGNTRNRLFWPLLLNLIWSNLHYLVESFPDSDRKSFICNREIFTFKCFFLLLSKMLYEFMLNINNFLEQKFIISTQKSRIRMCIFLNARIRIRNTMIQNLLHFMWVSYRYRITYPPPRAHCNDQFEKKELCNFLRNGWSYFAHFFPVESSQ